MPSGPRTHAKASGAAGAMGCNLSSRHRNLDASGGMGEFICATRGLLLVSTLGWACPSRGSQPLGRRLVAKRVV